MTELVNHFSFALAGALGLLAVGSWAYRRRTWRALGVLAIAALAVVGADLWLRPGEPNVASVAEFDRAIASGRPALVEFYSNY